MACARRLAPTACAGLSLVCCSPGWPGSAHSSSISPTPVKNLGERTHTGRSDARSAAAPQPNAGDDRQMQPSPASHLRIARPNHDLRASERFWAGGLGLEVLFRADASAEGGHALLMLGWPDAAWHLELVSDPGDETPAAPTEEDLLVLYLDGEVDPDVVRRLVDAGGTRVPARNPYWDRGGVTIADPDGYRLVLTSRSWP